MTEKKQITISMPKEKLKLWLDALRLPANQKMQGTGALWMSPDNASIHGYKPGYCCLGVLQCVVSGGKVEDFGDYPSSNWLRSEGITFLSETGDNTSNPYLPSLECSAEHANDHKGKSFKEIAQAIESCAVGY